MRGKKGLMVDIANNRPIAYGVAKVYYEQGASLAFTLLNDALKKRVEPIAEELGSNFVYELDVNNNDHLDSIVEKIKKDLGEIDLMVHVIAYAPKEALGNSLLETSKEAFDIAMQTPVCSLLSLTYVVLSVLKEEGIVLTLSYLDGVKYVSHYSVIGVAEAAFESSVRCLVKDLGIKGIRVDAISARPVKTLAASEIGDFRMILEHNEINSPLERNVSIEDVGNSATYLLSDLARGVTDKMYRVDAGYNIMGVGDVIKDENEGTVLCWDNQKGQ